MLAHLLALGVNAPPGSKPLPYAEADAGRFRHAMTSVRGPVSPRHGHLLVGASGTTQAARAHLARFACARAQHVIVYFAGHGSEHGVALADGLLSYQVLAADLRAIGAQTVELVLDTCHAGAAARVIFGAEGVGRLGSFDQAWVELLRAACPGIRLLAAVSRSAFAHQDASVQGGRFTYALLRALRHLPGDLVSAGGVPMISDAAASRAAEAEIVARWPNQAPPEMWAPCDCDRRAPMMISQAHASIGAASAEAFLSNDGNSVEVAVRAEGRRQLTTHIEAHAYDHTGRRLARWHRCWEPRSDRDDTRLAYGLRPHAMLTDPVVGPWLSAGHEATISWDVQVLDDRDRLLDAMTFATSYWPRRVA